MSKLCAAGELFALQILSVMDILGSVSAILDLLTLRVQPTLVGRLGGSRTIRWTEAVDRPFPDVEFTCLRSAIGPVRP